MPQDNIFRRISSEYRQGGLRHLVVGGLEKAFLEAIGISSRIYWRIAPIYYKWRCSNDVKNYQCPPDPFKIELVDPNIINRRTDRNNPRMNRRALFGKVMEGDWDKDGQIIRDTNVYQVAQERFVEDTPWKEIGWIRERFNKLDDGEYGEKYKTYEDILDNYRGFEDMYNQIKQEGYRSQSEIIAETGERNRGLYLDTLDEITVDVGRNGELLHVDGSHRLAIAKILDIDVIPVVFLVRHKEWMAYRDELCKGNEPIPDHPDLRDLK